MRADSMICFLLPFLAFMLWVLPAHAQPTPVLAFTDLTSGPKTGNSDTSQGQSANVNGAIVTVWGHNLVGASFTINGAAPAATYYVGNATPPACGAANLYNRYQKLQCAVLQVSHSASTGAGTIVATVGGFTSNTLPFTVASGHICFAATGGSGSSACGRSGTFSSPFGSIQTAINSMASGDILYVRNGLNATVGVSNQNTSTGGPRFTIAVYPGAVSVLGDTLHDAVSTGCSGCGIGITYSKFTIVGNQQAVTLWEATRLVGSNIQCPLGNTLAGCVGAGGSIVAVYGNEFTNAGINDPAQFEQGYHVLYFGGRRERVSPFLESNRDIGWNYFHDNSAARAVNIFNDSNSVPGSLNNPIGGHDVHDNVIVNQEQDAILFGAGVVGLNRIWNNVIVNAGLSNMNTKHNETSACLDLRLGDPANTSVGHPPNEVQVWNNSILNCGDSRASDRGAIEFRTGATVKLWNNSIYQKNGFPYVTPGSNTTPTSNPANISNGLWFGAGRAPSFETNGVNSNPLYVSDTSTYDLHPQGSSPLLGSGVNLMGLGIGLRDLDALARPSSVAWDIGAYQYSAGRQARRP